MHLTVPPKVLRAKVQLQSMRQDGRVESKNPRTFESTNVVRPLLETETPETTNPDLLNNSTGPAIGNDITNPGSGVISHGLWGKHFREQRHGPSIREPQKIRRAFPSFLNWAQARTLSVTASGSRVTSVFYNAPITDRPAGGVIQIRR